MPPDASGAGYEVFAGVCELFGAVSRVVRGHAVERAGGRQMADRSDTPRVVRLWLQRPAGLPSGSVWGRSIVTERKRSSGKVRHVRILGLCLVAVFAMSAMTAGSALAKKPPKPGSNNPKEWKKFENCPLTRAARQPALHLGRIGREHLFPGRQSNRAFHEVDHSAGREYDGTSATFECTEENKTHLGMWIEVEHTIQSKQFIGPRIWQRNAVEGCSAGS